MRNLKLSELNIRLKSLSVFRRLLSDSVIKSLCVFLDCPDDAKISDSVSLYCEFVSRLYDSGEGSLARHIMNIVGDSENVYICTVGRGESPSKIMKDSLVAELETLQQVADITPSDLRKGIMWDGFLPEFEIEKIDIIDNYRHRIENIGKYGYGIYAKYRMFYINGKNTIVPVKNPDRTELSSLVDYKREQQIIVDNTVALLEGKPAANILLTGDAGTGKSSTVKAVVNKLYDSGLRILEIRKEQLKEIPTILDELNSNPLKFILFIDDLSFSKDDDNFSALKAILEGSVSAKSQNVVIYATSNRRHLVKESFSDRDGDDVHHNDTVQEIISLSERFGIHITFQKPDKATYLDIVHHLCKQKGVANDIDEIDLLAERYALERGGRSARAATQFVDGLISKSEQKA